MEWRSIPGAVRCRDMHEDGQYRKAMINDDTDFDPALEGCYERMIRAPTEAGREASLRELLKYCAGVIQEAGPRRQMQLLFGVANALSARPGDGDIWRFLADAAMTADASRKMAMTTAIFELVPEDPVIPEDLIRLWNLSLDPKTEWVIQAAYQRKPRRMERHRAWYLKRRE